jgi:hypothetical protein
MTDYSPMSTPRKSLPRRRLPTRHARWMRSERGRLCARGVVGDEANRGLQRHGWEFGANPGGATTHQPTKRSRNAGRAAACSKENHQTGPAAHVALSGVPPTPHSPPPRPSAAHCRLRQPRRATWPGRKTRAAQRRISEVKVLCSCPPFEDCIHCLTGSG